MSAQMPIDFDGLALARANKDLGMARASLKAERERPGWHDDARLWLLRFMAQYYGEFMGWQVRIYAEARGFDLPNSKRAWGSVMVSAKTDKVIRAVRLDTVKDPRSHCAKATVWEKA